MIMGTIQHALEISETVGEMANKETCMRVVNGREMLRQLGNLAHSQRCVHMHNATYICSYSMTQFTTYCYGQYLSSTLYGRLFVTSTKMLRWRPAIVALGPTIDPPPLWGEGFVFMFFGQSSDVEIRIHLFAIFFLWHLAEIVKKRRPLMNFLKLAVTS